MLDRISILFLSIVLFTIGLVCESASGQVVLNGNRELNSDYQWVFVTVNVSGTNYKFTHVAPAGLSGAALQTYVDSQESFYKFDILRDLYKTRPLNIKTLADMEAWIAGGAILDGKPVTPTVWVQTHPIPYPATPTELPQMLSDLQTLLGSLTYADIDNHIDTVFSTLTAGQRTSLKRLYKAVLYLLKNQN